MSKDFLKEIEVPCILEILSEKWDNALELMHEDALVYGGAVRDIIAGLPLKGDLDIVGSSDPYSLMVYAFTKSTKWTPEGWVPPVDSSQGVKSFHGRITPLTTSSRPSTRRSSPPSKYSKHMAVDDTTSFLTFDNAKVQLIRARPSKMTGFKAALQVAREVDLVCCGFIMDKYGRVFEVIEGAYDDCINKVLRFNKTARIMVPDDLKVRVAKLKERGWASKISISRLRKMEEKAAAARRSEEERMLRTKKKEGRKNIQQIRSWLSVSSEDKRKAVPEVTLDISGLRDHCDSGTSLGYIKDVIVVSAKDFGWVKDENYNYEVSGRGIITVFVRASHGKVIDYAYTIAERIEAYGSGKTRKSSGRVWRKPYPVGKTAVAKRSMHDVEGLAIHTHTHDQIKELSPSAEQKQHEHADTNELVEASREILTFKASMRSDGQIEINTGPTDLVENVENYGSVEIDISSIPEEAQERVKQAFEESRRDYQGLDVTSASRVGKAQKVKQASDGGGYVVTKTTREE